MRQSIHKPLFHTNISLFSYNNLDLHADVKLMDFSHLTKTALQYQVKHFETKMTNRLTD